MPKKRSSTEPGSEVAPRRSTRVSAKPVPALNQKPTSTAGKTVKPNGKDIVKKAKTQTKPSKMAVGKAEDHHDSLSELSVESQVKELEDAEPKPPPKKKTKVDKAPAKETPSSSKNKLAIGEKLPETIILKNQDDADVNVLELTAEKGLIIFIYPKSNTPGCTTQACGYRDLHKEIVDAGFQVVGLSMDSPKAQTTWKVKQKLPYTLLCDPEQQLIKLLGSSKTQSSVQRSHFIFEAGGKLIQADPKATTTTSPKQALEFIQSLANQTTAEETS